MDNQQNNQSLPPTPSRDISENRVLALISYLGPLCFIPLFGKKDSPFVQFHAKQGLVLFIAELISAFINVIPFFGHIIWELANLFFLYLTIMGIIKSWQGINWRMPILGNYAGDIKL